MRESELGCRHDDVEADEELATNRDDAFDLHLDQVNAGAAAVDGRGDDDVGAVIHGGSPAAQVAAVFHLDGGVRVGVGGGGAAGAVAAGALVVALSSTEAVLSPALLSAVRT